MSKTQFLSSQSIGERGKKTVTEVFTLVHNKVLRKSKEETVINLDGLETYIISPFLSQTQLT